MASDTATAPPRGSGGRQNQRERILDTALALMSEHGADRTSMRRLAQACGMNVAGLYHYFPSKADLLRAVIAERQYEALLAVPPIPEGDLPPRERLVHLLMTAWDGSEREESIWRLMLAESCRGNQDALAVGAELLDTIESGFNSWLGTLFPELGEDTEAVGRVIIGQLFSLFIENLFQRPEDRRAHARHRAEDLAEVLFPGS